MLNDVDVVLVHRGRDRTVMSDAGASSDVSNINIILADETGPTLPDNSVISANQAWIPANYETGDTFPAPAPSSPIAEAFFRASMGPTTTEPGASTSTTTTATSRTARSQEAGSYRSRPASGGSSATFPDRAGVLRGSRPYTVLGKDG